MDNNGTEKVGHPIELIRLRDVERILGVGKSTIYSQVQSGKLPKPVKVGASTRWARHEVEAVALHYLAERKNRKGPNLPVREHGSESA